MADYNLRRTMMVDTQVRPSDVTKFPIIDAMLAVPRESFVPTEKREVAYIGENLDLGNGFTLLEPRTFAKILDALDIQFDHLVLDLACGLGYSSAVIARMAEAVVAIEENAELAGEAQSILTDNGADNVAVVEGNLIEAGAKHGPYDIIVIEGGVEQVPTALTDQLKEGGRIAAIFMTGDLGICKIGHKLNEDVVWRFEFNASAPVLNGFENAEEFAF